MALSHVPEYMFELYICMVFGYSLSSSLLVSVIKYETVRSFFGLFNEIYINVALCVHGSNKINA